MPDVEDAEPIVRDMELLEEESPLERLFQLLKDKSPKAAKEKLRRHDFQSMKGGPDDEKNRCAIIDELPRDEKR